VIDLLTPRDELSGEKRRKCFCFLSLLLFHNFHHVYRILPRLRIQLRWERKWRHSGRFADLLENRNLTVNRQYSFVTCGGPSFSCKCVIVHEFSSCVADDYKSCYTPATIGQFIVVQYVCDLTTYSTSTVDTSFYGYVDNMEVTIPSATENYWDSKMFVPGAPMTSFNFTMVFPVVDTKPHLYTGEIEDWVSEGFPYTVMFSTASFVPANVLASSTTPVVLTPQTETLYYSGAGGCVRSHYVRVVSL
jgi:hypothetical protein